MSFPTFRYHGDRNVYVNIATRGDDEHLGIGLTYGLTSKGSVIVLRFVTYSNGAKSTTKVGDFQHFDRREPAKFHLLNSEGQSAGAASTFYGARLNKLFIPVFKQQVPLTKLETLGDAMGLWGKLASWIQAQVHAEGFILSFSDEEFVAIVRGELIADFSLTNVSLALEFPDLVVQKASSEVQKAAQVLHKDEDDDSDDEEEDGDSETIN